MFRGGNLQRIDLAQERLRLTRRYADMSDGELEKLAKNPLSLAEWARDLLRNEMSNRGLEWKEQPIPDFKPSIEMPTDDNVLVLLRSYENALESAEDQRVLRHAGVKA